MSRFRRDMKLAYKERARRAPAVIDLDPSEWEEVRDPSAGGGGTTLVARVTAGVWIAVMTLLVANVAAPVLDGLAHHAL
jgi:hypothetical protein